MGELTICPRLYHRHRILMHCCKTLLPLRLDDVMLMPDYRLWMLQRVCELSSALQSGRWLWVTSHLSITSKYVPFISFSCWDHHYWHPKYVRICYDYRTDICLLDPLSTVHVLIHSHLPSTHWCTWRRGHQTTLTDSLTRLMIRDASVVLLLLSVLLCDHGIEQNKIS